MWKQIKIVKVFPTLTHHLACRRQKAKAIRKIKRIKSGGSQQLARNFNNNGNRLWSVNEHTYSKREKAASEEQKNVETYMGTISGHICMYSINT